MAELILWAHFLTVLFLLAGFPVSLRLNIPWLRYAHSALLAFVTALMLAGLPCPLTVLEEAFSGGDYSGSFLAAWAHKLIYLPWFDPGAVFILDLGFALLVFSSFYWRPLPPRRK